MRRQFPYKKIVVAAILLAASVALLNVTGKPQEGPWFWESLFAGISRPFYGAVSVVRDKVDLFKAAFADKTRLMAENDQLKKDFESVDVLQARLQELESENSRLKDLLQFKENTPAKYTAAKVIGRDPSKWFSTMAISLGTADGVAADDPVVSRSGLIGRVISAGDRESAVLLLTDPESGVGAAVEGSRDYGVVVGGNGPDTLVMQFFSRDAQVVAGDKVVTSGIGSKFPAGILIGEVVSVYVPKPGLVKEATVKPATDMNHLEEVMVVLK